MQNDGETRDLFFYFFKDVKTQGRGDKDSVCVPCTLFGLEFGPSVACSDRDRKRINLGLANKIDYFRRQGLMAVFR